jgi:hypothetical protein
MVKESDEIRATVSHHPANFNELGPTTDHPPAGESTQ